MSASVDLRDPIAVALWRRALPEERLLFRCLRHAFDEPARQALALAAAADLAWDEVLGIAVRHQVAPLVLHALGQAGALPGVPETVRANLHREMLANVAAKAALRAALRAAARDLGSAGLDVMAVKGTSLDLRLPDPALTVSGDVDLLLRQDWAATTPEVHARVAALNAGRPVVDVDFARHPDLVLNGVLPVDFAAVWASASATTLDGVTLWLMALEHELLCACINSVRKRVFRLKSLYEIAELLRTQPTLDWDAFARAARAWRCAGVAHAALRASAVAADATVPPAAWRALGLRALHARLLDALVARMSWSRLATMQGGARAGGKRVGRALLLGYASLGARGALHAGAVALRQAMRGPSRPHR